MTTLADRLERTLRPLGTADRAKGAKAYLKSDLDFLGISVPEVRSTVKALARATPELDHDALVATVETLWARGIFELRSAATELLALKTDLLGPADLPLVERLVRESKTWALVDFLSTEVIGELVKAHPALAHTLDRWATDEDFWIRRAAMLALLVPLRRGAGDFVRFGRYADAMLEEREFFIRKAIGWILREVGRKRPELVVEWLAPRAHRASGLTLREATRNLSAAHRAKVLAGVKVPAKARAKR